MVLNILHAQEEEQTSDLAQDTLYVVCKTYALTCLEVIMIDTRPGRYQTVGLITIVWFVTEADNHSSVHCAVMFTSFMYDLMTINVQAMGRLTPSQATQNQSI